MLLNLVLFFKRQSCPSSKHGHSSSHLFCSTKAAFKSARIKILPMSQDKFLPLNGNIMVSLLARRQYLPSIPSYLLPGKLRQASCFLMIYFREGKSLTLRRSEPPLWLCNFYMVLVIQNIVTVSMCTASLVCFGIEWQSQGPSRLQMWTRLTISLENVHVLNTKFAAPKLITAKAFHKKR